jgi:rsbT antagonist protein RsbS
MARIPIVRIRDILIAAVQEEIRDADALWFQEELHETIERSGVRGVLIDLSVAETVDSFLGRLISDIALGARLLGAQTVVVGIQPAVAITLVELGLDLGDVRTALNAEKGLVLLERLIAEDGATKGNNAG